MLAPEAPEDWIAGAAAQIPALHPASSANSLMTALGATNFAQRMNSAAVPWMSSVTNPSGGGGVNPLMIANPIAGLAAAAPKNADEHGNIFQRIAFDQQKHPDHNLFYSFLSGFSATATDGFQQGMSAAAGPLQVLTKASDETKWATPIGPTLWGLHKLGIGKQGDEWDHGVVGLLGTSFDKLNRLGAAALVDLPEAFRYQWHHPFSTDQDPMMHKGWDLAFNDQSTPDRPNGDHLGVGQAFVSMFTGDNESLLSNPDGLAAFEHKMNQTWWGGVATGVTDLMFNMFVDPTKVIGKVAKAARAGGIITSEAEAERLSRVSNAAHDSGVVTPGEKGLPNGVTVRVTPNISPSGVTSTFHIVEAFAPDGSRIGHIVWKGGENSVTPSDAIQMWGANQPPRMPHPGEIMRAEVDPAFQKQGIANEMFHQAQGFDTSLHHSNALTQEGEAFAKSTKWDAPGQTTPTMEGQTHRIRAFVRALDSGHIYNPDKRITAFANADLRDVVDKAAYHEHVISQLDDVKDVRHVMNWIAPLWGMGGSSQRYALPIIAELMATAARTVSDLGLQRQIKLNIMYALAGSQGSMRWLVENAPDIAAKGRRVTRAPEEYSLLKGAMDNWEMAGNDVDKFDLTKYIEDNVDASPARQAELQTLMDTVIKVRKFQRTIETGGPGPGGGRLYFDSGKMGGVQVAPRTLEMLKTALNNRVLDSHLLQNGPSGLTVRVVNHFVTPGVPGFIHIKDAEIGNKQLMSTMREFARNVNEKLDPADQITAENIRDWSDSYLAASQAERINLVSDLNSYLLEKTAKAHGMTVDYLRSMLRTGAAAMGAGRRYAERSVRKAAAENMDNVVFGDLSGTATILDRPNMETHLQDTQPLWDWRTANEAAKDWNHINKIHAVAQTAGVALLHFVKWYHKIWKYAQLMRPGLMFRALLDTDMRAIASVGSGTMMLQAMAGAKNLVRNRVDSVFGRNANNLAVAGYADMEAAARAEAMAARLQQRADFNQSMLNQFSQTQMQTANQAMLARYQQIAQEAAEYEAAAKGFLKAADVYRKGGPAKRSIMTKQKKVRVTVNGQKRTYTFAPSRNDLDTQIMLNDTKGNGSQANLIMGGQVSVNGLHMRIDPNHWNDHMTGQSDAMWPEAYATTAEYFRNSYTARRLMAERDAVGSRFNMPDEVFEDYRLDPQVWREFKETTGGGTIDEFADWLGALEASVRSFTPTTALRDRLMSGKKITGKEIREMFPKLSDRFPIFGPQFINSGSMMGKNFIDRFFHTMLDLPDEYLARVPMANALYHKNAKQLLEDKVRELRETAPNRTDLSVAELKEIHNRAWQRAANDVRRDMYDVHRYAGSHGLMTYISPFFAPWEDAMMSWGRIMYDDPKVFGQLMRYAQAPTIMGWTEDKDGNKNYAWDGTPLTKKFVKVPLAGVGGLQYMRWSLNSLNSINPGNSPLNPGVGPLVQLAGLGVVAKALPHLAPGLWKWMADNPDNPISQTLFLTGDAPRSDLKSLVGSQLPSSWRTLTDSLFGDSPLSFGNVYTNAYGTRLADLIRHFRETHGGRDPNKDEVIQLQGQADSGARFAAGARFIMNFGLGISGNAAPEGQYYVDQMHNLLKVPPEYLKEHNTTIDEVFARNFGAAGHLNWTFSVNDGALKASVDATTAYMKHQQYMDNHKDIMWWIAGPDNLANNYSATAYNQQVSMGLRHKLSPQEIADQNVILMGAAKYQALQKQTNAVLEKYGLKSMDSPGAGTLKEGYNQALQELRKYYPAWATDFDTYNRGKVPEQIEQIQEVLKNPPTWMRDRPDVVLTQQYLAARQQVADFALKSHGISGWQSSTQMEGPRQLLRTFGEQLASQDLAFEYAWHKLFEKEFNTDIKAEKAAQAKQGGQ